MSNILKICNPSSQGKGWHMNWRLTSLLTFVGCLVNLDTDPSVGVWVWWSLAAAMSLKREAGAVRASRWLAKNPILQENARIFRISISILCKSRWWFQIFLIFTPIWGNNPILTNIFQMGWFNHQPDMFFLFVREDVFLNRPLEPSMVHRQPETSGFFDTERWFESTLEIN